MQMRLTTRPSTVWRLCVHIAWAAWYSRKTMEPTARRHAPCALLFLWLVLGCPASPFPSPVASKALSDLIPDYPASTPTTHPSIPATSTTLSPFNMPHSFLPLELPTHWSLSPERSSSYSLNGWHLLILQVLNQMSLPPRSFSCPLTKGSPLLTLRHDALFDPNIVSITICNSIFFH